ncbi:MAG: hypothetical protein MJ131_01090 [Lachnospiraceae bacterium]|nr:hypothetical protein [Lachnospiraceae bacterium]
MNKILFILESVLVIFTICSCDVSNIKDATGKNVVKSVKENQMNKDVINEVVELPETYVNDAASVNSSASENDTEPGDIKQDSSDCPDSDEWNGDSSESSYPQITENIMGILINHYPVDYSGYRYPEADEMDDSSGQKLMNLYEIPEDILTSMSTEELVQTVVFYPLLYRLTMSSMLMANHDDYSQLKNQFNGLKELSIREDRGDCLWNYFIANKDIFYGTEQGSYAIELLKQDDFNLKERFLEVYNNDFKGDHFEW